MIDQEGASFLRRRYDYQAWAEPTDEEEERRLDTFVADSGDLAEWDLVRVYEVPVEGARVALQTIWRSAQAEAAVLRIDIVVMPSAREARDMLLRLLGEFQSPLVRRRAENPIGDVSFEMEGGTAFVFADANVVVQLRNGGARVVGLEDVAREFHAALLSRKNRRA